MKFSGDVRLHLVRCAKAFTAVGAVLIVFAPLVLGQQPLQPFGQLSTSAEVNSSGQTDVRTAAPVSAPASEPRQNPPVESEKSRLKVNPVTGVAISPGADYVPLTGKERWNLYWKQNYWSVGAYFAPVFIALALDQTTNTPPEWGGGFRGYGRRVASRFGSGIVQGTFQAPVAALLHEDVRYISSPRPENRHRVLHAIAFTFLTYNSRGRPTPNIANLGGIYAAAAVSTKWFPESQSLKRYTLINGSAQVGLTIGINFLQEFWSEATGVFSRRR
jgi:hypothetical protein